MSGVTSVYSDITGHIRPDVRRDVRDVPDVTSGKNRVKNNISCDITEINCDITAPKISDTISCDIRTVTPDITSDIDSDIGGVLL
jgi:hypothetical protein